MIPSVPAHVPAHVSSIAFATAFRTAFRGAFAIAFAIASAGLLLLSASGCGDTAGLPTPEVTVSDSLGIVIRTLGHTEEHLERWGHDPEPVVEIGALEGDTPDVFGRITSLKIRADGSVVVSDGLAGEIRSFSLSGEHLWSAGALGEGPGEFSNSISLLRISGDSIWVWDQRQQRVSVFAGATFADSWTAPGEWVLSNAVLRGSDVFGQSNMRLSGIPETGMSRPTVQFARFGRDGSSSQLFETDGHERFLDIRQSNGQITGVSVFQPPFARGPFFGVIQSGGDTRIIGGPNDRFVLREWTDEGELGVIHRYPTLDRPVTDALVDRARQRIIERYSEPTAGMRQELTTLTSEIPETLPAFDRVWSDDEGRLWVRRSDEDRVQEWLVLDLEDLEPMATIILPAGFALLDIRDGLLGGYWLDELDVSHVRVYRLRTEL